MKCYTGSTTTKVQTDCPTGSDVCAKITTAGVVAGSCYVKATATAAGHPGDGCKDIASLSTCLCATELCNDPSEKSSASTQSAFQFSSLIAASYLMKLLLA